MAIHVGEDLRVVAEHSSWRVDVRRVAVESGKARWEPVGYYQRLGPAFTLGVLETTALQASGLVEEVRSIKDFVSALESLTYGLGTTISGVLDMAWLQAAREWQALGVEGVPANPREWSEEQTKAVHDALAGDTEALNVFDRVCILQNWDNLLRRIERGKV